MVKVDVGLELHILLDLLATYFVVHIKRNHNKWCAFQKGNLEIEERERAKPQVYVADSIDVVFPYSKKHRLKAYRYLTHNT